VSDCVPGATYFGERRDTLLEPLPAGTVIEKLAGASPVGTCCCVVAGVVAPPPPPPPHAARTAIVTIPIPTERPWFDT
jgi:hypothetical protein